MKATWGETSDEESEVEDGDNENLALMAKSDTDSDNDSSEQMSVENMEMSKILSNLKSGYNVLKKEKIESENTIETLNAEIKNLEEIVSVQKTENSKLMGTISSLKDELNTIKERKTSSSEISNYDQCFHEAEITSLKKKLCKEKMKNSELQVTLNQENYDIALMKKWNKSSEALNWLNEHYNRSRTGLGYKNKPVKWDQERKYVGLAEYKLCSHCGHTGHVRYECLARIKDLEKW
ncbi:hypothetical protein HAX54_022779 [Datura stramonium]|uniref:CCHC-type domain-containing protein n=1 Tax=Datura stramonium TaxID=4076 RepID=A0ABS8UV68_DATST|nr:hypothetical protein [Datura stramonium]